MFKPDPPHAVAVVARTKDQPLFLERAARGLLRQRLLKLVWVIMNDGDSALFEALVDRHRRRGRRSDPAHPPPGLAGHASTANADIDPMDSTLIMIHDEQRHLDRTSSASTTSHLEQTRVIGVAAATDIVMEQFEGGEFTTVECREGSPG